MAIQSLGGYGGFSSYYKMSEIPVVKSEELQKQKMQIDGTVQTEAGKTDADYSRTSIQSTTDSRSRTADFENISLTFNREENYDYIGSESELANLDVQKAISDMRKDQVLQEYQYFVGNAQSFLQGTEDGMVIPKLSE